MRGSVPVTHHFQGRHEEVKHREVKPRSQDHSSNNHTSGSPSLLSVYPPGWSLPTRTSQYTFFPNLQMPYKSHLQCISPEKARNGSLTYPVLSLVLYSPCLCSPIIALLKSLPVSLLCWVVWGTLKLLCVLSSSQILFFHLTQLHFPISPLTGEDPEPSYLSTRTGH